jgi:chromosomal replication initiation ATPase DnaA
MSQITFETLKKPIEERLIDAACIYYDVDREYFFNKNKREDSTVMQRKGIVYYLLRERTSMSFKQIAEKFGFVGHQPALRIVDNISSTKNIYKQLLNDLTEIERIASTLEAELITVDIKLTNKKILQPCLPNTQ